MTPAYCSSWSWKQTGSFTGWHLLVIITGTISKLSCPQSLLVTAFFCANKLPKTRWTTMQWIFFSPHSSAMTSMYPKLQGCQWVMLESSGKGHTLMLSFIQAKDILVDGLWIHVDTNLPPQSFISYIEYDWGEQHLVTLQFSLTLHVSDSLLGTDFYRLWAIHSCFNTDCICEKEILDPTEA